MDPIRSQIASLITSSAQAGLDKLDKNSPLACKLKNMNIDTLLKDAVNKVVNEMSYIEMAKLTSLMAQFKCGCRDIERVKKDTKHIAKDIFKRIKKKSGDLKIPSDCLDMLFNL